MKSLFAGATRRASHFLSLAMVFVALVSLSLVVPKASSVGAVATSVTQTSYVAGAATGITIEYTLSTAISGGRNILYLTKPAGYVFSTLSASQLGSVTTVYKNDVLQTTSTFLNPAGMWSGGIQYWLGSGLTAAVGTTLKFVIPVGYITNPGTTGVKNWQFKTAEGSGAAIESFSASTTVVSAVDTTAPTLSSSVPADSATGVGLGSNIVLNFSESVIAVSGKNIVLKKTSDDSVVQSFSVTGSGVSVSGSTVTVNPSDDFDYSTGYYLLVDGGAFRDAADNVYEGVLSATALNFTTIADTTDPTLSSSTPADNATGVGLSSNIVLTFSESVSAVSGKNIVLKKTSDDSVVQTLSVTGSGVSVSGSTVTVNPSVDFDYSTGYYLLVDVGAFKDAANNMYAGISSATALNFTTIADTTDPILSSSTPADNATGVGLSSNIVLTFSESVSAVSGKDIVLKKVSDNSTIQTISVTGSAVVVSGSSVTVNPSVVFDYSMGYYLLVDVGAFKDAANNVYAGISSATALNFTTIADTTAPTLSSSTPADNATGVATASNIALSFGEDVVAVSGKNITIHRSSDDIVVETISVTNGSRVSIQGSTVSINPSASFTNSVSYYVLVDVGAFRDVAGNSFAGITGSTDLNFSVVASTVVPTTTTATTSPSTGASTSTTAVPVVSPSNISVTTLAAGSTATTIKGTNSTVSTTTVPVASAARSRAAALASTTTTSTTTTTTSPKRPVEIAPEASAAVPGTATALINGQEVELSITRIANKVVISSSALKLQFGVVSTDGAIVPLDADGNVVVDEGAQIEYAVSGAKPGALLDIWLFSEPFKLGSVVVGDDGTVSGLMPVSANVAAGAHRLVVKTETASGDEATYSLGVMSGSASARITVSRIIFGILLAAVVVGLIIPATRRRRRSTAQ